LDISWTYTPDIGATVEVEYSLDYGFTWVHIATVSTTETPKTSWTTPATGYYNTVYIRITSTKGMTRTSEPFSIGTKSTGSVASQQSGYSVANYPNPANGVTTISFELGTASSVTLS